MRKGNYISVSVVFNTLTKFAKLAVGKHVVCARQRGSENQLFPLTVALNGLHPLSKVEVNYEPYPKNSFKFRVNGEDFYNLVKEEVDFDPSKTETLHVYLNLNEKKDKNQNEGIDKAICGATPWIINEVEDKIQTSLGME